MENINEFITYFKLNLAFIILTLINNVYLRSYLNLLTQVYIVTYNIRMSE